MKKITAITLFNDQVGQRVNISYANVEEGKITSEKSVNMVLEKAKDISLFNEVYEAMSSLIGEEDDN